MANGRNFEPVNDSLNRPLTKFGLEYRTWIATLVLSLFLFLLISIKAGIASALFFSQIGVWITRKDPKMPELWLHSFTQASIYDPGKVSK